MCTNHFYYCSKFYLYLQSETKEISKHTFTGTHKEHNFAKCERWMINPAWVRPPRFHFFKKAWFLPNQQSLSKTAYSYFHCKPVKLLRAYSSRCK